MAEQRKAEATTPVRKLKASHSYDRKIIKLQGVIEHANLDIQLLEQERSATQTRNKVTAVSAGLAAAIAS